MRNLTPALILLLAISFLFTGCIQTDRYVVEPQPPHPPAFQYGFEEEFTHDVRGWAFDDQFDSAYALVQNGLYKFVDYSWTGGYHIASVPTGIPVHRDFLIETRFRSDNAMALVFGASVSDYGYSIFIDDQGYYALYKEGLYPEALIDWEFTEAIRVGNNDLELEQSGSHWYGYINGIQVFRLPARQLSGNETGFMVLAGTTGYADFLRAKW